MSRPYALRLARSIYADHNANRVIREGWNNATDEDLEPLARLIDSIIYPLFTAAEEERLDK